MIAVAARLDLADALALVAAGATERDRRPAFPGEALRALGAAGVLGTPPSFAAELALVRAVARADASVGRIVDGHLNALERVALLAPDDVREEAAGRWLGVWGADPGPGEGEPAALARESKGWRLRGTKTFCSGAGGLDAALVVARGEDGRRLALVELGDAVEIDRAWFQGSGLRASESHRVHFHDAPVRALLGGPDEIAREPWFGRDAIRTAASWAGIADAARGAALAALASAPRQDDLAALATARMAVEAQTIDRWLGDAGRRADADPGAPLVELSVSLRAAVAAAASRLVGDALRAAGARPLVAGGALDRAGRDLRLFLLQKRLDPLLVRSGRAALARERAAREAAAQEGVALERAS